MRIVRTFAHSFAGESGGSNLCPTQIGVSSDSVEKQKEFATKNDLNYTLLADTKKEVRKAYGVGGTALLGIAARKSSFHGQSGVVNKS